MKYFKSFLGSILLDEKIQIGIEEESILIYILEEDKIYKYNKNELSIILVKEENEEKIYSLNEKYNEWGNKNKFNIENIKKNNYISIISKENGILMYETSNGLILFDQRIQKELNINEVLLYVNKFNNIENYDKNEIKEDIKKNRKKEINPNEKKQLIINYNKYILNIKNVEDNHKKNLKSFNLPSASIKFVKKQKFRASNCWCCKKKIDNKINFECTSCGWILCDCGACGCGYYENIEIKKIKEEERILEIKNERIKEEEKQRILKINLFYEESKTKYDNIYYDKNKKKYMVAEKINGEWFKHGEFKYPETTLYIAGMLNKKSELNKINISRINLKETIELNEFIKIQDIIKFDIIKSKELSYIKKHNLIIYSNKSINIEDRKYNKLKDINNSIVLNYNKNNKEEILKINKTESNFEIRNNKNLEYYKKIECENFTLIFEDDYIKEQENNNLYKFENNKGIIYIKHQKISDKDYILEILIKIKQKS